MVHEKKKEKRNWGEKEKWIEIYKIYKKYLRFCTIFLGHWIITVIKMKFTAN